MLLVSWNCQNSWTILLCFHQRLTPWNWNWTLLGIVVWCVMVKIIVEDIQNLWILYCLYKLSVLYKHFFLEIGWYDFNLRPPKLRVNDVGRNGVALCCAISVNRSSKKTINDAFIPASPLQPGFHIVWQRFTIQPFCLSLMLCLQLTGKVSSASLYESRFLQLFLLSTPPGRLRAWLGSRKATGLTHAVGVHCVSLERRWGMHWRVQNRENGFKM